VDAAIQFIDREGLGELSMRRLASELDTGTTTLYRHVSSKEEVLVLVVDAVFAEVEFQVPEPNIGWRELLGDLARSMRSTLSNHSHVANLFALSVPIGPNSLRAREVILGALRNRGFESSLAADVYTALAHHVLASVLQQSMTDYRGDPTSNGSATTLRSFYRSLPKQSYPHIVELANQLTSRSAEEEFDFALNCFFDGVELRLSVASQKRGARKRLVGT
jgi:AcrR family transcriptional regulator